MPEARRPSNRSHVATGNPTSSALALNAACSSGETRTVTWIVRSGRLRFAIVGMVTTPRRGGNYATRQR
jgi:hypothetical protein